jgi:uncharacterized membrane protein YqjE
LLLLGWCCLNKSTSTFLVKLIATATRYGVIVLFSNLKESKGKLIFLTSFTYIKVLTLKLHLVQIAFLVILIFLVTYTRWGLVKSCQAFPLQTEFSSLPVGNRWKTSTVKPV